MDMTPRPISTTSPRRGAITFFYGKLLDEMHLRMEQDYFNGKRWMLNRLALGRGVLCGLEVTADGKTCRWRPASPSSRMGREIVVPQKLRIDTSKIAADCGTLRDRDAKNESQDLPWRCVIANARRISCRRW